MPFSFCVVIFAAFVGAFTVPKVYDIYHVSTSRICNQSLYFSVKNKWCDVIFSIYFDTANSIDRR